MNLSPLLKLFSQVPAYNDFAYSLQTGHRSGTLRQPLGVLTAARPALVAALQGDLRRPILLIAARADRAKIFAEQIQFWSSQPESVFRLPDPDSLPHEKVPWGNDTIQGRLSALSTLVQYRQSLPVSHQSSRASEQSLALVSSNQSSTPPPSSLPAFQSSNPPILQSSSLPPIVIASARGLMHQTLPPGKFTLQTFKVGQRVKLNDILAQWVALGYKPEEVVEAPGSFSRRGGILDIFPTNAAAPVRIELFGDEIDSLRLFDPASQRSDRRIKNFTLGPATETLPGQAAYVAEQLSQWDLSNLQPSIKRSFEEDIVKLASATIFRGIEYYLPFFYNGSNNQASASNHASLLDYLPDDTLVFVEDPNELAAVVDEVEVQARTLKRDLMELGDLPGEWPDPYFSWSTLLPALLAQQPFVLGFTGFNGSDLDELPFDQAAAVHSLLSPVERSPYPLQSVFVPPPAYGGQVKNAIPKLVERKQHGDRLVLVTRQDKRLASLLEDMSPADAPGLLHGLDPEDPPPPPGSITLLKGVLIEGFVLKTELDTAGALSNPAAVLTVLSDSELFGFKKPTTVRRPRVRKGVTPETFFADVNAGDLVVHIEHGIGRYVGLVKLSFDGVEREYLSVEYANGDKLYVPIHQADRLARYVGPDDAAPPLNRLGSADWNTVKRRAKKAVEDIAKELLEIYAKREVALGHAFSEDVEWQREVEDAFPFVETDDQLRAIADVKADMEKSKPMDRLICGDVGYGKTEVALRAAFKAVMDGKQVAVLAPTTVLAQQHYQTFSDRLENYPVRIEILSRFRTKPQQDETLNNLLTGITDIVIGTHRLLQRDVKFKNLGLLIIDEEQRFGVKQKERLKLLRTEVDVLTLTATPIPRTLHMSLSGVRDLSTIDTPPEERLPVQTVVTVFDEQLIRKAILRELDRGGQAFYVYNRVMGIEQKANRLRNILPEARVEVAHGQMSPRQLERVMVNFIAGEFDVLVCTTIVESGLDMPNVNTLIVDRADRMGLAQLYQLRGRVGRGAVQAYAYFLMPKHQELNSEATKRLEAIAEATELGSGFRIAMRDLEIRGAGDLLGAKQHGHMAAVGFDLYTRLLAQAIREINGDGPRRITSEEATAYLTPLADSVQLNLPIPAFVPEDYLPEEKIRFRLYRRLAGITTLKGIDEMAVELQDRFGELPEPLANLLYQLRLKILAMEAGVQSVTTESGQIVIRADSLENIDRDGLQRRLGSGPKVNRRQIMIPLHPKPEVWQAKLEKTLKLMGRMLHDPAA